MNPFRRRQTVVVHRPATARPSMWGPAPLDRCPDPGNPGQEVLLWRSADYRHHVIRVVDVASGDRVFIDVAPTESALQAVASTWGLTAEQYAPARAT